MFRKWKIEERKVEGRTTMNVRLLRGKYKGLLYHYGMIEIIPSGEFARLKFEMKVIEEGKTPCNLSDPTLVNLAGDILSELLTNPEKYGEILVSGESDAE